MLRVSPLSNPAPMRTPLFPAAACVALLVGDAAAGDALSTSAASADLAVGAASVNGAFRPSGCNLNGGEVGVLAPLNGDEAYYLVGASQSATCIRSASGKSTAGLITFKAGDDIPRPDRAVRVTSEDNPLYLINYDVYFDAYCTSDAAPGKGTFDWTAAYTPGVVTFDCRF